MISGPDAKRGAVSAETVPNLEEVQFLGAADGRKSTLRLQLAINVLDVRSDRFVRDTELLRDLV